MGDGVRCIWQKRACNGGREGGGRSCSNKHAWTRVSRHRSACTCARGHARCYAPPEKSLTSMANTNKDRRPTSCSEDSYCFVERKVAQGKAAIEQRSSSSDEDRCSGHIGEMQGSQDKMGVLTRGKSTAQQTQPDVFVPRWMSAMKGARGN